MNYPLTLLNSQLKKNEEILERIIRIKNKGISNRHSVPNIEKQNAELRKAIRLINKKMK